MPYQIYISDTSADLDNLRPVLVEQIRQMGMTPVWIEEGERQQKDLPDIVRRKINEADAFISIVTYKRGWQPDDMGGKSLAEMECDIAMAAGKPLAVLLPAGNSDTANELRQHTVTQSEAENEAQRGFWRKLESSSVVTYFKDVADLSLKVTNMLAKWATQSITLPLIESQEEFHEPTVSQTVPPPSPTPTLTRERRDTFFPTDGFDVEAFADQVAEKTAQKVQAVQQQQADELAQQTLKYNAALQLKPGELVFGRPSEGSQFQGDIFMIMPFKPEFNSIYTDIIRPMAAEHNLKITRGDEFTSVTGVIMTEVWSALNNCKFVIAEITGGNDNVFYELGIAHTLNKPAILITQAQKPDDVPFDIRHLRYIQYENTVSGGVKLRKALKTAIARLLKDLQEGWGKAV